MVDSADNDDDESPDEEFDLDLVALEEARRTIDKQNEVLNNIDDKAARILRINLVIMGLLLTGLSLAMGNGGENENLVRETLPNVANIYTESGLIILLFSTALAALTYTASALRIGVTGDSLEQIVFEGNASDRKRLRGLAKSYSSWIRRNHQTNAYNAPLATGTLLLLVYSVTLFALGGIEALRTVRWYEILGATLFLLAFTYSTKIHRQISRYYHLRGED
ncbi:hypothetical protein KVP02_09495 [Halobacterium salinarum]|uniref:hypothetical protein n=1 Tax=Halobacterium salinarum TaxID=2242 RepID=UPI001F3C983C|nr:hypothetical protein [Halobacterium salinarum]MCF2207880.1 hypothetical protein [Halobacterium salinarum]